jgi:diguanylate cyclase (GGDEF)-like protein
MVQAGHSVDQSITDSVTGAYARGLLLPRLAEELERAEGSTGALALFLFDVDFFKTVNDAYGHLRGDEVLRQLVDRVKGLIRGYDALFRYGGDEFVLLLPGTDRAAAVRMALRITDEIRAREFGDNPPLHVSVSLGVATFPDDGADAESLIGTADRRNYLAKRRGRGGAVADDADTEGETAGSRLWERDAAMAATHEFFTRLDVEGSGALRVGGEPGSGHTRFIEEVAAIARLRGYSVLPVPSEPTRARSAGDPGTAGDAGTAGTAGSAGDAGDAGVAADTGIGQRFLLLADVASAPYTAGAVARLRAAYPAAVVGLAYASTRRPGDVESPLPELASAQLLPWSPATLKIWLRNSLLGEPNRVLVSWLMRDSGGLPARAARGLDQLRQAGGMVATAGGGWTLAPAMLGRPRRRSRLPVPMTPLMGREAERDRVCLMLDDGRLVTLVGPGGIGKTRLALTVAAAVAEGFEDGAVFVPLADTTDPDLVVASIAHALEVTDVPGRPLLDAVVEHLTDTSLLLVLDNFEQVMGAAKVISGLLAAGPGVSALITSRERLGLYGEQIYPVPPLPLPDMDTLPAGAAGVARALADSPALALFEQRARAATGAFALAPDNLGAVAALCRRLDGLPLAIELAAARTDRWRPEELLEHLAGHLDALGAGPVDLPERQQTLRGAIDWSFALLDPPDQRLFVSLSAFAGGWTLAAAAGVAGADAAGVTGAEAAALAERLDRLAGKSLLVQDGSGPAEPPDSRPPHNGRADSGRADSGRADSRQAGSGQAGSGQADGGQAGAAEAAGDPRYRMLETIRAYATARLDAAADADDVRDRHRAYFVDLAIRSGAGMTGPDQARWTERLDLDYQNLRTAMRWALSRGDVAHAAEVCMGLWRYWRTGNHLREGRDWLGQVLAAEGLAAAQRAAVLHAAAVLATNQDEHEAGYRLAEESLALAESAGLRPACAHAHNAMGIAAIGSGEYHLAREHFRRTLAVWQELADAAGTAIALGNLTKLSLRLGDIEAADRFAGEALALERAADNPRGISLALECIGQIRLAQGDVEAARVALKESLRLNRSLGDVFGEAMALHQLGLAAYDSGDRAEAMGLLTTALERRFAVGDQEDLAVSLECVAHLAAAADPAFAATLLGAADALRERRGLPAPPEADTRREATLTLVRGSLDPQALASARSIGRTAPLDLIIDEALDLQA